MIYFVQRKHRSSSHDFIQTIKSYNSNGIPNEKANEHEISIYMRNDPVVWGLHFQNPVHPIASRK